MSEIDILGLDRYTLNFLKIEEKNLERSLKGFKGIYNVGDKIDFEGLVFTIYECGEIAFGCGKYFYKAVYEYDSGQKRYVYQQY